MSKKANKRLIIDEKQFNKILNRFNATKLPVFVLDKCSIEMHDDLFKKYKILKMSDYNEYKNIFLIKKTNNTTIENNKDVSLSGILFKLNTEFFKGWINIKDIQKKEKEKIKYLFAIFTFIESYPYLSKKTVGKYLKNIFKNILTLLNDKGDTDE